MDQIQIGKFIAGCRKERGLTQAKLAEKFGVSDRAVSKWETGRSMPDTSIMLELCSELDISVNELLSGKRLTMENYKEKAERNLLEQHKREARIKRDTKILALVVGIMVIITLILHLAINYYYPENNGTGMGLVLAFTTIAMYLWFFIRNYEIRRK